MTEEATGEEEVRDTTTTRGEVEGKILLYLGICNFRTNTKVGCLELEYCRGFLLLDHHLLVLYFVFCYCQTCGNLHLLVHVLSNRYPL